MLVLEAVVLNKFEDKTTFPVINATDKGEGHAESDAGNHCEGALRRCRKGSPDMGAGQATKSSWARDS